MSVDRKHIVGVIFSLIGRWTQGKSITTVEDKFTPTKSTPEDEWVSGYRYPGKSNPEKTETINNHKDTFRERTGDGLVKEVSIDRM
jgi:hypothetical protein